MSISPITVATNGVLGAALTLALHGWIVVGGVSLVDAVFCLGDNAVALTLDTGAAFELADTSIASTLSFSSLSLATSPAPFLFALATPTTIELDANQPTLAEDPGITFVPDTASTFTIRQNDQEPEIGGQILQSGSPVDITGATVAFLMRPVNTSGVPTSYVAAIDGTPTDGRVKYDWSLGGTTAAGTYDTWFQVTLTGGDRLTLPTPGSQIVIVDPEPA